MSRNYVITDHFPFSIPYLTVQPCILIQFDLSQLQHRVLTACQGKGIRFALHRHDVSLYELGARNLVQHRLQPSGAMGPWRLTSAGLWMLDACRAADDEYTADRRAVASSPANVVAIGRWSVDAAVPE